jgi:anti-sigma regulatory factor (Ser/Thr protein kinase)
LIAIMSQATQASRTVAELHAAAATALQIATERDAANPAPQTGLYSCDPHPQSRPDAHAAHRWHRAIPGCPGQIMHARRFVRAAIEAHPRMDDAVLLVSELVTKVIQHTATSHDGTFEIVICALPGSIRIAVIDAGSPFIPAPVPASSLRTAGRGVALIQALAQQWGYHGNQHSGAVWFQLDDPSDLAPMCLGNTCAAPDPAC